MSRLQEVKNFARDYINGQKTPERRQAIREAYEEITGESFHHSCDTCYIEAIFKILKHMDKPACNYRLRKGYIIQPFGGGIVTNDNLTNEIAEQALRDHTANASMFAVMPEPVEQDSNLTIVPPASTENKEANNGAAPAADKAPEAAKADLPEASKVGAAPAKQPVKTVPTTTENRSHKAATPKKSK
jgi:hypothetical protein